MDILLDTHVFIWFSQDFSELSEKAKYIIRDPENPCYVSIVTFWEMAIKISLDRLEVKYPLTEVLDICSDNGIKLLPLKFAHVLRIRNLPLHHKDPFDRMLIAQCQVENISLITKDETLRKYDIDIIW